MNSKTIQILRILLGAPRFARTFLRRPTLGLIRVAAVALRGFPGRAAGPVGVHRFHVGPVDALLPRLVARPRREHLKTIHLLVELVV